MSPESFAVQGDWHEDRDEMVMSWLCRLSELFWKWIEAEKFEPAQHLCVVEDATDSFPIWGWRSQNARYRNSDSNWPEKAYIPELLFGQLPAGYRGLGPGWRTEPTEDNQEVQAGPFNMFWRSKAEAYEALMTAWLRFHMYNLFPRGTDD